jgi:hypothetical protein
MLGAERLLSDRQRALCNWNGLQVLEIPPVKPRTVGPQ